VTTGFPPGGFPSGGLTGKGIWCLQVTNNNTDTITVMGTANFNFITGAFGIQESASLKLNYYAEMIRDMLAISEW
jgi:hypothetical protein